MRNEKFEHLNIFDRNNLIKTIMTLPQLGFFLVVVNFQFILIMVPITTNYVSSYEKRITKILCPKERVYHVFEGLSFLEKVYRPNLWEKVI